MREYAAGGRNGGDDPAKEKRHAFSATPRQAVQATLVSVASATMQRQSLAAVTGGRIGGSYTTPQDFPSIPQIEQQQSQQNNLPSGSPSGPGFDIGAGDLRTQVRFKSNGHGPRRSRQQVPGTPDKGDAVSTELTARDTVVLGIMTAGVLALQRYNEERRREGRGLPDGLPNAPGGSSAALVTTLQVALFHPRGGDGLDVLSSLKELSQTADVNSREGLAALIDEVMDGPPLKFRAMSCRHGDRNGCW